MSCRRGRVTGGTVGRVILSLVAVPVAVTRRGAPSLANLLSHALIRIDTSSAQVAAVLSRAGLPIRTARNARYRHSPPGALPFAGALTVPGRYGLKVKAPAPDPTNPHDHRNDFRYVGPGGRSARLALSTDQAFDRFCLTAGGGCSASVSAPRRSALARLLGGTSATARIGFDHSRIGRIDLRLPARKHRTL